VILLYKDPRKRALQVVEIVALVVMLPFVLTWGARTWSQYAMVVESEKLFDRGHQQMHASDWKGAVQSFDACVAVNPQYFPAYEARADIYYTELKDLKKAIASLEAGLTAAGNDPRMRQELGEYYLYAKRYRDARDQLAMSLEGDPGNLTCKGLLKRADVGLAKSTL